MSHSERAAYYRERAKRWGEDLRQGLVDEPEARGWIVHDLSWARFHVELSQGKKPTPPPTPPRPILTLRESIDSMPEDVDVGDPDDVYSL